MALLSAFRIFNPLEYQFLQFEQLDELFNAEISLLVKHFAEDAEKSIFGCSGSDFCATLLTEFSRFKEAVFQDVQKFRGQKYTVRNFWGRFFSASQNTASFPHMLILLHASFVIAMQTACVERGFSLHRIFKSRLANRLRVLTLDSLLRIKMKSRPDPRPTHQFQVGRGGAIGCNR